MKPIESIYRTVIAVILAIGSFLLDLRAEEITTSGLGGGRWSDGASWKGGKVPAAGDEVVIRKFDVISFDRSGEPKPSCRKLQIDPKGVLQFQSGVGQASLIISDGIENFGIIKADATRSPRDRFEIRLTGDTPEKRQLKLGKGAALLLYGHQEPSGREPNVRLVALLSAPGKDKEPIPGLVDVDGPAAVDLHRVAIVDMKIAAKKIDNTGAKTAERINILDCRFAGTARLYCHTCDTPIIARNRFEYEGGTPLSEPAIHVLYSPLTEVKSNRIVGKYLIGVNVNFQSDSTILDNVIERCATGINGGYGIPNTMIKGNSLSHCETGIKLEGASGVVEQTKIEGATSPVKIENSNLQLTGLIIQPPAGDAKWVTHVGGELSLLNCGIRPEQVVVQPRMDNNMERPSVVTAWECVVIGAAKAPAGSIAEVRTVDPAPPPNAADLNVRFSPAAIVDGKTPRPDGGNAIVVKSWSLDAKGPVKPPPGYEVRILGPVAEGAQRPVLKAMPFRPAADAPPVKPEEDKPTLEVPL